MSATKKLSKQTRQNWLIDAALFVGAVLASLSGIYFLYLPSGGYMGGRNPMYGITILFDRHTWDDLHTWGGIAMIAAAAIHFVIHWKWVSYMTKRVLNALAGRGPHLIRNGYMNVGIDVVIGLSFLVAAASGLYFFFVPETRNGVYPQILFDRTTWDLLHTWSGVVMIAAAVVHFAIHWRWVTKVTGNLWSYTTASLRMPWGQTAGESA